MSVDCPGVGCPQVASPRGSSSHCRPIRNMAALASKDDASMRSRRPNFQASKSDRRPSSAGGPGPRRGELDPTMSGRMIGADIASVRCLLGDGCTMVPLCFPCALHCCIQPVTFSIVGVVRCGEESMQRAKFLSVVFRLFRYPATSLNVGFRWTQARDRICAVMKKPKAQLMVVSFSPTLFQRSAPRFSSASFYMVHAYHQRSHPERDAH